MPADGTRGVPCSMICEIPCEWKKRYDDARPYRALSIQLIVSEVTCVQMVARHTYDVHRAVYCDHMWTTTGANGMLMLVLMWVSASAHFPSPCANAVARSVAVGGRGRFAPLTDPMG